MKRFFYGFLAVFLTILPLAGLFAQQKYALVIGNAKYVEGAPLQNAENDANDITAALQELGFTVDKLLNASLDQMEDAAIRLKNRLSVSTDSYGFFFYAGHGVQADGVNYLLPVDARIPDKNFLKTKAFAMQPILDMLNDAGNALNIIVLDACRDLPMAWSRSADRGLSVVNRQPAKSIIMYATAAGKTASDGTGRNGLFTQHLLTNLKTPGLDVKEVFNRTGEAVANASNYSQLPATYSSFYGTAYLGTRPAGENNNANPQAEKLTQPAVQPTPQPSSQPTMTGGSVTVNSEIAGEIFIDGQATGRRIKAGGTETINNVSTGSTEVWVKDSNGATVKAPTIMVRQGQTVTAVIERPVPNNMVRINGGTFTMGSPANEPERRDDEAQHQVTVSGFYMGKYEVTQKEYQEVMGTNPSRYKEDNMPVENVNWYEAIEYCNKRSQKEGLTPAYTRNGDNVTWNKNANGYRLPTEAEWEYACRAGTTTPFSTGNNITTSQANYDGNNPYNNNAKGTHGEKTMPVGSFASNAWGLYDMHGNVMEWCWDWYGGYANGSQTDPSGISSGSKRVIRGGNWIDGAKYARSACRFYDTPSGRSGLHGFRLVRP